MAAYAIRFNIQNIKLFYPSTINGCSDSVEEIIIKDELSGKDISIKTYQLPVVGRELIDSHTEGFSLNEIFEKESKILMSKIRDIF